MLAAGVVWLLFPVSGFLVVAVCTVVSSSSSLPKSRILESCSNCLKKRKNPWLSLLKYSNFDMRTYLDLFSIKSDMAWTVMSLSSPISCAAMRPCWIFDKTFLCPDAVVSFSNATTRLSRSFRNSYKERKKQIEPIIVEQKISYKLSYRNLAINENCVNVSKTFILATI